MKIAKIIIALVLMLMGFSSQLSAQETLPEIRRDGVYFGIYSGTWFGTGNNAVLGNSLMGGLLMEIKSGKSALSFNFDFFGNLGKTQTLYIKNNDQTLEKNNYTGVQISLQYGYELYVKNRFAIEAVGGAGYGDLGFKIPETEDFVSTKSFFIDPGLGARYFIGQKTFLQFKLQYNLANYKLNDNVSTNIGGNFVTTKLILGWR